MPVLLIIGALFWLIAVEQLIKVLRGPGLFGRIKSLVGVLVWVALAGLLSSAVVLFHFFKVFSGETLVATVDTKPLAAQRFAFTYTPADGTAAIEGELAGDQWSVSGGIIKWHPVLTALGLKSYHRPMRISGEFSNLVQQRTHFPSVYPLQPEFFDWFWEGFYWVDRHLPFVEAVYGSSAYAYAEPGVTQEICVTPSGYLIKRKKRL